MGNEFEVRDPYLLIGLQIGDVHLAGELHEHTDSSLAIAEGVVSGGRGVHQWAWALAGHCRDAGITAAGRGWRTSGCCSQALDSYCEKRPTKEKVINQRKN